MEEYDKPFFFFFCKPLAFQTSDIFGLGAINAKCTCMSKNEIADILNFLWTRNNLRLVFSEQFNGDILNFLHLKWSCKHAFMSY